MLQFSLVFTNSIFWRGFEYSFLNFDEYFITVIHQWAEFVPYFTIEHTGPLWQSSGIVSWGQTVYMSSWSLVATLFVFRSFVSIPSTSILPSLSVFSTPSTSAITGCWTYLCGNRVVIFGRSSKYLAHRFIITLAYLCCKLNSYVVARRSFTVE